MNLCRSELCRTVSSFFFRPTWNFSFVSKTIEVQTPTKPVAAPQFQHSLKLRGVLDKLWEGPEIPPLTEIKIWFQIFKIFSSGGQKIARFRKVLKKAWLMRKPHPFPSPRMGWKPHGQTSESTLRFPGFPIREFHSVGSGLKLLSLLNSNEGPFERIPILNHHFLG